MTFLYAALKKALQFIMGAPDEEKPARRWGLRHTAIAGTVLTVGQLYALQDFVFTRKEGEALAKNQSEISAQQDKSNDRFYKFAEKVNTKLGEIEGLLRAIDERGRNGK